MRSAALKRRLFGIAALGALTFLVITIVGSAFSATAERREAERWHLHTLDVLLSSSQLKTSIHGALRGERGYLLTGDRTFLVPYDEARPRSLALVQRLRSLTGDNPVQQRNLDEVSRRLGIYLDTLARLIAMEADGRHALAIETVRAGLGRRHVTDALTAVDRFDAEERRLLALRQEATAQANARAERQNYVMAALAAVLMLTMAAAVISAARAHRRTLILAQKLAMLATTDALTGLPNRRRLMEAMELEVARAARSGRPLALALLDVDHFKAVNDTHGHPAGDEVLRCVAEELRRIGRSGDVLGRFGGEEFAVLMPETDLAQARRAGERLRAGIAKRTIHYPDGSIGRVTVSAGVALLAGDESCDLLVSRADAALYEAKADGRNLVRLAA